MAEFTRSQRSARYLQLAFALILALFSGSGQAVIAVDSVSTVVDNNPTTLTVSHTTGAGSNRLMIVGVSLLNRDLEVVNSVTYNGVNLNFVGQVSRSNDSRVELWSYLNPPNITANVVVTFNEQVQIGATAGVITFTGVNQTSPYGFFQSNTGNSTTATASVSSAIGELVIGVMAADQQDSNPVVVGGSPRWALKAQPGNNRTAGAGATFSGAAITNLRWNLNESDDWAVGAISLRDAAIPIATIPGFCDDFESGLGNWSIDASGGGVAGINGNTFKSAGNALFTRGGQVNVFNNTNINAAGKAFQFSLWIRRGDDAFSEDPDNNENLQIQYLNNLNAWVTLETFLGNGTPGEIYERRYALPAAAQHAGLRVRVLQTNGNNGNFDFWHVDDVCVLEVVQPNIELRMDELQWNGTANEVIDSSGNGNDANANAASGLTTINPGQICRAGDFDGVDDYIESSDIFAYLRTTASMSFWIRTTQTGNNTGWLAPGVAGVEEAGGSDDIFWGWLDASGRIGISVGNAYTTKSTVAVNDGSYHHVVLTRNATSGAYKIYIDGVLDASGTSIAGIIGNSFSSIGRIEDTGGTPEYLQGELDELLVFNSVLSDSAVTSIYTNQSAGRNLDGSQRNCAGALAWFQLDADAGVWNGTAGEVVDQSGNFPAAFALGTGAGVDSVPAQVCRGIDVPFNNSNALQYGFDSGIDIDNDVGNLGSLSFWYNSNTNWVGGGNRMLADASPNDLPGADKYFFLTLLNNGRLLFALEDSADRDFTLQTGVNAIAAGVWTHIAVTWNMSGNREIYVNGVLAASQSTATSNGQIGALRTLYLGDNRSTYHPGGSANSANGIIDEVRVYDRVQSAAEIIVDLNVTRSCSTSLTDHLSIAHDGTAVNCQAESVTISAHTASGPHNVDIAYTGSVSLSVDTAHGDWSYVSGGNAANFSNFGNGGASYLFDGSENGSVVLALRNTYTETVDINASDGTYTESSGSADASDDPALVYAATGFNFLVNGLVNPVGTQISGKNSDNGYGAQMLELQAIKTNDQTGACEAALSGPAVVVEMAFECVNANTCQRPLYLGSAGPSTQVAGTNFGGALNYSNVSLDFGDMTDSTAVFVMNYPDAGQIRLHARYALLPSGEDLLGNSNNFVVRPFGFDVDVPHPIPPHAGNESGNVLTAAGVAFSVNVSGVLWNSADDDLGAADGIPDNHDDTDPSNNDDLSNNSVTLGGTVYTGTPNFGQENEDIELTSLLFAPSGGVDPGLPGGTAILSFTGGSGTNPAVVFNEVGIIEIAANVIDLDYLGIGLAETARMTSKSGHVGRFTPQRLEITSLTHGRFANANPSGAVPFTYIGQNFGYEAGQEPSFTVSALNAGGGLTQNYTGVWAKLNADSANFSAPTADSSQNGSDGITPMALSYTQNTDFNLNDGGAGTIQFVFRPDDDFNYSKNANSQVAPFSQDIDLVIVDVTDADGIATLVGAMLEPLPPPTPANEQMRFGRLRMENAFGSELSDLIMNYHIEFYDMIGATPTWIRLDDLDTSVVIADIIEAPGNTAATAINPGTLPGKFEITLSAPGIDVVESITNEVDTSGEPWLQFDWDQDGLFDDNPAALATFGIYEGNPVQIYIQQIYEE